jgi:hypothetical protein
MANVEPSNNGNIKPPSIPSFWGLSGWIFHFKQIPRVPRKLQKKAIPN